MRGKLITAVILLVVLLMPAALQIWAGLVIDLAEPGAVDAILYGQDEGDFFGSDLTVGDLNGDGVQDLAVGAYLARGPNNSRNGSGEVYVFLGKSPTAWFNGRSPDLTVYGAADGDSLGGDWFKEPGHIVIGDLDNDGLGDLIVSSPTSGWGRETTIGRVYILWGREEWPESIDLAHVPPTLQMTTVVAAGRDGLGAALAMGDFDGDGIADLAMSAPLVSAPDRFHAGKVYVLFGADNLRGREIHLGNVPADIHLFTVVGPERNTSLGSFLAFGRLSDDAIEDLVIGSEKAQGDTGLVHVLFGSASHRGITWDLATQPADWMMVGEQALDQLGHSLAVGEITGDEKLDLLVGAPSADGPGGPGTGQVVGIFGPLRKGEERFLARDPGDLTIYGPASDPTDQSWLGEVAVGDVNGDGTADLLAGARQANGFDRRGESGIVYLFFGGPTLRGMRNMQEDMADITWVGAEARDFTGYVVAGDLTGDHLAEVVMSAIGDWPDAGTTTGKVYIAFGQRELEPPTPTDTPTATPQPVSPTPTSTSTAAPAPTSTPEPRYQQYLPLLLFQHFSSK